MIAELIVRTRQGRALVRQVGARRTADVLADLRSHLSLNERLLDIGSGTCDVAAALRDAGYRITPCDVRNLSAIDDLVPVIFDGTTLPFRSDSFDVSLLVNVLHHVADPDSLLIEAKRVARKIIIHEDIYNSTAQRLLTYAMDSVTNLEFIGHPHSNRDDHGWRQTFARLGLTLTGTNYKRFWGVFASATYVVERIGDE